MEKHKVTITQEGAKKLADLEKRQENEIKERQKVHKEALSQVMKEREIKPESRLKFWSKTHTEVVSDNRFWALVNVESLKDFVKYGANKVLDQIRIRTHANIVAREEIEAMKKKKDGFDVKAAAFTIVIVVIAAAMAWIIVQNFFNYNVVATDNIALKKQIGDVTGKLAACSSELKEYKPDLPKEIDPGTLEG